MKLLLTLFTLVLLNSSTSTAAESPLDKERTRFYACMLNPKCKLSEFKVKPVVCGAKTEKGTIPPVRRDR